MGLLIIFAFFAFVTSSSFGDALRAEHQRALAVPNREHFLDTTKEALLQCVGKGNCECWLSFLVPENGLPDVLQGHKYLVNVFEVQATFRSWAVGSQERIDAMTAEITSIFRTLKEEAPYLQIREHRLLNFLFVFQGWCTSGGSELSQHTKK